MPELTTTRKPHTAGSAAVLLMASALLSGVLGLVRIKYINHLFGPGVEQDAYRAAFALPDLLAYFLIGGAASISLITILNRYRESSSPTAEADADRALSVILTNMLVVLGIGVLLGELFAPQYVWLANKGFRSDPARFDLCVSLTRIILPAQIFFFIGSAMGSRLQVRKIFIYQACAPLIYNLCIILGAVCFQKVTALAIGVFVGMFLGYALLSSLGAFRTGLRYTPTVNFRAPAFREWFKLSLPLMIGVSLVMFDRQFLNYFASVREGGITLIGTAKDLFNAPFNVIGPAAGAASLPFFASLFQQKKFDDFSRSVSRSVSRLFAVAMLVSAWMIALAPWLMDLFRGGRFNRADAAATTQLFIVLAITLGIWSVQGIYARAFYAASDTMTPAITGTLITVASVPVYWLLFHTHGLLGLALASDIGITIQTLTLATLLHRKGRVLFQHLEWPELARSILAALLAFVAAYSLTHTLRPAASHLGDIITITAGSLAWLLAAFTVLQLTGSKLPAQILRRKLA